MAGQQKLGIRAYTFTLRRHRSRGADDVFDLNGQFIEYTEEGEQAQPTALDIFKKFASASEEVTDDEDYSQLFHCEYNRGNQGETDVFSYLIFSVYAGRYGYKADIVDRRSKTKVHSMSSDQAEVKQFYVTIVIPKDGPRSVAKRGLLFFQEIGAYGVKTITTKYLQDYISKYFKLTIKTANLAPDFYLQKIFEHGVITKIKLGHQLASADPADRLYGSGFDREERTLTPLEITREMKRKLKHVSESEYNFYTFDDIDYQDVRMVVKIGDRERTINLHGIEDLSVEEALPDALLLADGTIDFEGFKQAVLEIAEEYLQHLPTNE